MLYYVPSSVKAPREKAGGLVLPPFAHRCIVGCAVPRRCVLAAVWILSGCSSLRPVARHPWVEERTLALSEQRLEVEVREHVVRVDARLHFRELEGARTRTVSFAVAGPRGAARRFVAELEDENGRTPLRVRRAEASPLPQGEVADAYDIHLPRAAQRFVLHVRYEQPGRGRFQYALLTGAYWFGPIERLAVIVRDPEARVVHARLERALPRRTRVGLEWSLHDVEPHGALELALR